MRSINLSASSIKDFLRCSKKYYYRVNYPEVSIQTASMKVGTVIHSVIEKADDWDYTSAYSVGVSMLNDLELYHKEYKTAVNKLEHTLKNYYNFFINLTSSNDIVERFFKIPLDSGVFIVGRIDRLNTEKGIIIDWKTNYKDPRFIDDDAQFLLYKYAYTNIYKSKPISVLYANLFTGRLISLNDLNDVNYTLLVETTIPYILSRIKNNELSREGIEKNICKYCPFKEKCFNDMTEE